MDKLYAENSILKNKSCDCKNKSTVPSISNIPTKNITESIKGFTKRPMFTTLENTFMNNASNANNNTQYSDSSTHHQSINAQSTPYHLSFSYSHSHDNDKVPNNHAQQISRNYQPNIDYFSNSKPPNNNVPHIPTSFQLHPPALEYFSNALPLNPQQDNIFLPGSILELGLYHHVPFISTQAPSNLAKMDLDNVFLPL